MANNLIDINTFSSTYLDWKQHFDPDQIDYSCETQPASRRWCDFWVRVIIFPLGIYRVIHGLVGRYIISRAADLSAAERTASFQVLHCGRTKRKDGYLFKHIRVLVDGLAVDGTMVVHPDTVANGRWLLYANENHECYEGPRRNSDREFCTGGFIGIENRVQNHITDKKDPSFLAQIQANAILFNYPGVGEGDNVLLYRDEMVKAHYVMRRFLEDQAEGIGAREIICFGSSIGAGIQGEDIDQYPLDERVRYCFIKNKAFSEAAKVFSSLLMEFGAWLTDWNICPVESSSRLEHPEIIVQTIRRPKSSHTRPDGSVIRRTIRDDRIALPHEFLDPEDIIDDDLIPPSGTLADALLRDNRCDRSRKHFVGVYGGHGKRYNAQDISLLADLVNKVFNN